MYARPYLVFCYFVPHILVGLLYVDVDGPAGQDLTSTPSLLQRNV